MIRTKSLLLLAALCLLFLSDNGGGALAFTRLAAPTAKSHSRPSFVRDINSMSTIEAPPDERIDTTRKTTDNDNEEDDADDIRKHGPLEYLEDDPNESRLPDDPFHILLMDETFDKPKVTVNYVSGSLQYVLDMPFDDALDATIFCQDNGFSCLGTWERQECLKLGRELRLRDIVVRVVPYAQGGNRGWQSRDADGFKDMKSANFLE